TRPMNRYKLIDLAVFLLIILFTYAALSKLLEYDKFTVQLSQSPLLAAFAGTVAWSIPALEIVLAVLVSIPRMRLYGLYGSYTLMVIFTAYIIAITRFSDYVPCSCGGVLQKLGWTEHLVFNLFFVALCGIAILLQVHKEHKSRPVAT
ncbi:hypothetical protein KK062_30090, partial [Fulvivirgaceae bacterium PWU5]